ncbi:MAG: hypothetical protein SFY70_00760 [Bacteroidia bacterium]|nr:hypothetical protein [Bacteroidia bacterium]
MLLVNFIAICLLVYIVLRVVWLLFGRQLAIWGIRRIARKLEDELLRQQNHHTTAGGTGAGAQEIFVNREVKIRVPKTPPPAKQDTDLSRAAEDVEFEDLDGPR